MTNYVILLLYSFNDCVYDTVRYNDDSEVIIYALLCLVCTYIASNTVIHLL